jgi:hypothetical protein
MNLNRVPFWLLLSYCAYTGAGCQTAALNRVR